MSSRTALTRMHDRAVADRERAHERWTAASAIRTNPSLEYWADRFRGAGRLTLNFHPDRVGRRSVTTAAGLLADGHYRSQWITGSSAGSRSAIRGGERQRFERELFAAIYEDHPRLTQHPVYGALDLLFDEHGGSPRFGSCFFVLKREVLDRTTLCIGDSHAAPIDVGVASQPWSILAGLAEQAAEHRFLNRALGVNELLGALEGSFRSPCPSRDVDGYVEAQVHGGVSLADDVDSVVLDPSFRDTAVDQNLTTAAARYGFELRWHRGSELDCEAVPSDFRGPTMPALARRVARSDGVVDAHAIGVAAAAIIFEEPKPGGDPPESGLQQVKYLWHTVLACGHDP